MKTFLLFASVLVCSLLCAAAEPADKNDALRPDAVLDILSASSRSADDSELMADIEAKSDTGMLQTKQKWGYVKKALHWHHRHHSHHRHHRHNPHRHTNAGKGAKTAVALWYAARYAYTEFDYDGNQKRVRFCGDHKTQAQCNQKDSWEEIAMCSSQNAHARVMKGYWYAKENRPYNVVAFSGTNGVAFNPDSMRDWMDNANRAFKTVYNDHKNTYMVVHEGFYEYLMKVWPCVEDHVAKMNGKLDFVVGHSLGGAAATLYWQLMSDAHRGNSWVVTFGAPATRSQEACTAAGFRFYHQEDPVASNVLGLMSDFNHDVDQAVELTGGLDRGTIKHSFVDCKKKGEGCNQSPLSWNPSTWGAAWNQVVKCGKAATDRHVRYREQLEHAKSLTSGQGEQLLQNGIPAIGAKAKDGSLYTVIDYEYFLSDFDLRK